MQASVCEHSVHELVLAAVIADGPVPTPIALEELLQRTGQWVAADRQGRGMMSSKLIDSCTVTQLPHGMHACEVTYSRSFTAIHMSRGMYLRYCVLGVQWSGSTCGMTSKLD